MREKHMRTFRWLATATILVAMFIIAGCSDSGDPTTPVTPPPDTAPMPKLGFETDRPSWLKVSVWNDDATAVFTDLKLTAGDNQGELSVCLHMGGQLVDSEEFPLRIIEGSSFVRRNYGEWEETNFGGELQIGSLAPGERFELKIQVKDP